MLCYEFLININKNHFYHLFFEPEMCYGFIVTALMFFLANGFKKVKSYDKDSY